MSVSRRLRLPAGFLLTVAALAAGVALGVGGASLASRTVAGADLSPGPILIGADGRTLAGTVGGSCASGYLKTSETAHTVTVVLHRSPTFMIAPGSCGIESFVARLSAPLGSRRLIDGVTGQSVPSFNGATILHPGYLPDGYVHRYDTATLPDEQVSSLTAGCVAVYTQPDSYDEAIWITQQLGVEWTPPDGVATRPVTVHGHPGLAIPGEVEWTENGELITVQAHTYAYATPDTAQLLRIADSLQ